MKTPRRPGQSILQGLVQTWINANGRYVTFRTAHLLGCAQVGFGEGQFKRKTASDILLTLEGNSTAEQLREMLGYGKAQPRTAALRKTRVFTLRKAVEDLVDGLVAHPDAGIAHRVANADILPAAFHQARC